MLFFGITLMLKVDPGFTTRIHRWVDVGSPTPQEEEQRGWGQGCVLQYCIMQLNRLRGSWPRALMVGAEQRHPCCSTFLVGGKSLFQRPESLPGMLYLEQGSCGLCRYPGS